MSQEAQTDLIKAINRLAEAVEKMGKTYVSSPVVPTTKKPKTTSTVPQGVKEKSVSKDMLTLYITSDAPHPFNNGKGVFYKGTATKNGLEIKVSLGVHTTKCDTIFEKGQTVRCTASYAGVDDYGETKYWLSELIEVVDPTEPEPQEENEELNNESEDMDVPF